MGAAFVCLCVCVCVWIYVRVSVHVWVHIVAIKRNAMYWSNDSVLFTHIKTHRLAGSTTNINSPSTDNSFHH